MFQRRGKEHIRYIRACAEKLFERDNTALSFEMCLVDAMKRHREHIKRIMNATEHFNNTRPTHKSHIKRIMDAGSYRPTHGGYSALNDN